MLVSRAFSWIPSRSGFYDLGVLVVSSHQQLCFANSFHSLHLSPTKANSLNRSVFDTSETHKSWYSSSASSEAYNKEGISNFADLCFRDAGKLLEELKLLQKETERLNKLLMSQREENASLKVKLKLGNQSITDFIKRVEKGGELSDNQQKEIEELQIKTGKYENEMKDTKNDIKNQQTVIEDTKNDIKNHQKAIEGMQLGKAFEYTLNGTYLLCVVSSVVFICDFTVRKFL